MDRFIEQFREIHPKFSRLYTRLLGQVNLTQPQYAVLLELAQTAPEPMMMTAVSHKLHITKPAVTSLVDRLEKHGFLKRLSHPHDRRVSLLQIQPAGKRIVEKVQGSFLGLLTDAAKQFSTAERKTVQNFYAVLSRKLDKTFEKKRK
ncbi:MAG: MarR family transcriptional regulator [Candidatus Omnitrophica bacterium]|nr:MarR family transcriptional regulator [Candidatus Omnitrophota bacterium]